MTKRLWMRTQGVRKTAVHAGLACVVVWASGCGVIADKDRIRIAKIGDSYITRGDLMAVIRDMPAEERPVIRTKGDVLHMLQTHIDAQLKSQLAQQLENEGKIHVSREAAAERYYALHPDKRVDIKNPEQVGLTKADVDFMKDEVELQIDRLYKVLQSETAVGYLVRQSLKDGVQPTQEEYQREFDLRKDEMKTLEQIVFRGIYFPATDADAAHRDDASAKAAEVRKRLKAGEKLDALITEYTTGRGGHALESAIENNPALPKFYSFWQQASGAGVDDIIGPAFISGWDAIRQDEKGKSVAGRLPDAYLVCVVLEQKPEAAKTFEQAKPDLTPTILYAKEMEKLRQEKGVEIYEDRLPDPSLYDTERVKSVFDTK